MNETLKEGIIKEAGIAACKILVTAFKICGLKTHIEQMFIEDTLNEEYVLKFYSKEGISRLSSNKSFDDIEICTYSKKCQCCLIPEKNIICNGKPSETTGCRFYIGLKHV